MGSPLAPFLEIVFMSFFERKYLSELKCMGLKVWLRYIDISFNNRNEGIMGFNYLNSKHTRFKITVKFEEKKQLPFLDSCVLLDIKQQSTIIED